MDQEDFTVIKYEGRESGRPQQIRGVAPVRGPHKEDRTFQPNGHLESVSRVMQSRRDANPPKTRLQPMFLGSATRKTVWVEVPA